MSLETRLLPRVKPGISTYKLEIFEVHFQHSSFLSYLLSRISTMSKVNIPKTQTAAVIGKIGGAIEIRTDHPVKQPDQLAPGECLVHIEATGMPLNFPYCILF